MRRIVTQKDLRSVRDLPFCYSCGEEFTPDDATDHDHVPAEAVFAKSDRLPLKLRTHVRCNGDHHLVDEKIGQLISLRRLEDPWPKHPRLKLSSAEVGTLLLNLDIDTVVWRWIRGFHAALYREALQFCETGLDNPAIVRSIVLPFPTVDLDTGKFEDMFPQHLHFVKTIKTNRFKNNLDQIKCNKGQLVYECVWTHYDNVDDWFCIFALNVCDWKDLGAVTPKNARGCAGHYMLKTRKPPEGATVAAECAIVLPNYDRLDPYAP